MCTTDMDTWFGLWRFDPPNTRTNLENIKHIRVRQVSITDMALDTEIEVLIPKTNLGKT